MCGSVSAPGISQAAEAVDVLPSVEDVFDSDDDDSFAAVDDDVLTSKQYAAAYDHCETVHVLSSRCDQVLKFAYPAGDFFSDIFGDNDSPFTGALGRYGPQPFPSGGHATHNPIPKADKYDHGDYMPSPGSKWPKVADYMRAAIYGQRPAWP